MIDQRPIYLDCNATTPLEPRVKEIMLHYMEEEFGNPGSRTHIYGQNAAKAVNRAREQIAAVVDVAPEEVIFTSGATEANNLAILGLAEYGERTGKKHIISTQIEHKAVLEPLELLEKQGFEVELVPPTEGGYVEPEEIGHRLRDDTLLVSVMHVNNETGIIQPLPEICEELRNHDAFFHVDAAQGFGKELTFLPNPRIDMISASAHKVHGPVGVGSLIVRKTRKAPRALRPRQVGGGQERGLRSGTIPTFLVAGFGEAAKLALEENEDRIKHWRKIEGQMKSALDQLPVVFHGDESRKLANTLNFSIGNIDSEAVIIALRQKAAIASGSACTSSKVEPSHVILSMYGANNYGNTACRASWSHLTPLMQVQDTKSVLNKLL